jgi:uncharacterized protein (TIGR04206 family)
VDASGARRLLVVLALGLVPWTIAVGVDWTFVLPFGLVNSDPWALVWLDDYLRFSPFGRYQAIETYVLGVGVYAGALLSALGGAFGVEDRRLTGGLLVVAGVAQFPLVGLYWRLSGPDAVPVGSLLLVLAAWRLYWPAVEEWIDERVE